MKNNLLNLDKKKILIFTIVLLILIALLTKYYGSTDIGDYADTAKYFSGRLSSDIRNSHSYLEGFIHAPFVKLFGNFFIFKITSLIALLLIVYSIYIMSNKDSKTMWLVLLSPVVWYMAPWINPIQIASLFFLWAYYFMRKYDYENKIKYLVFSGVFIGLAWAFWDTILFFGAFLAIVFMYDKKLLHSVYLGMAVIVGLLPRLVLDYHLFGFPFYTIMKSTMGTFANIFGGIYGDALFERASEYSSLGILALIPVLLAIPIYFWILYKPAYFKNNKKSMIFLSLSLLLIFANPQIRYTLILVPIIILLLGEIMTEREFKIQTIASIFVIIIFIAPYIIQIAYPIDGPIVGTDFSYLLEHSSNLKLGERFPSVSLEKELNNISRDYPNQTFVVGNRPDDYQLLARMYWGDDVKEFVSIQDYEMNLNNRSVLFEKKFSPSPKINDRRQIWLAGGMNVNENDDTAYKDIKFGIGVDEPLQLERFKLIKKYDRLYLSKKII